MDIETHVLFKDDPESQNIPIYFDFMKELFGLTNSLTSGLEHHPPANVRKVLVICDKRNNDASNEKNKMVRIDIAFNPRKLILTEEEKKREIPNFPPAMRLYVYNRYSMDVLRQKYTEELKRITRLDERMALQ